MPQVFRNHRKYQLLKWIDALEREYDARGTAVFDPSDNEPYPPTVSNLAYYLIVDGDYREDALKREFSRTAARGTPDLDVFNYVKNDVTRHLTQYSSSLFDAHRVTKSQANHAALDEGIESRQVTTTAYPLTERGKQQLERLEELIDAKQTAVASQSLRGTQPTGIKIPGDDKNEVKEDSLVVPVEKHHRWATEDVAIPRVKFESDAPADL